VQWDTPLGCGPPNTAVAVLSHNVDARNGAVSMDLRVVLSPPGTSPEDPSSTRVPQSQQRPRQPSSSAALQRANRTPGEMAAEKRDLVCCHWKKGWCRYENSCKFKHPTKQHGIGDACGDPLSVATGAKTKSRFRNPRPNAPAPEPMIIKLATLTECHTSLSGDCGRKR